MTDSSYLDLLERLIAIDSSAAHSNLPVIDLIEERLAALGATCRRTYDDSGTKANLHAVLGPADRPGIMLSGHTDVVPVAGQAWSSDPFTLTRKDDRLVGRGTADMKSFIALAVGLAPEFVARGLAIPLHFSFSYDEELGCVGVRRLIAELALMDVKPKLCIVGEPTSMELVVGHKGKRSLRCHVRGKEGHSALGTGVNAVTAAARLIVHIADFQKRIEQDGLFDPHYDPPYATVHTGLVQGGTALNIVPSDCSFEYEIRALPKDNVERLDGAIQGHARDRIEPDMKAGAPGSGFDFTILNDTAGFELADGHEVVRFVAELTGGSNTYRASFGTEAGLFTQAGVPSVVCGPGSIEQAHKPDEFITLDQIAKGEAMLRALMDKMAQ